jgi:hypothetical protein
LANKSPKLIHSRKDGDHNRNDLTIVAALFDSDGNLIPKTAVDPELGGQLRDLPEVSTAARFTEWVTTAIAANICG